MPCERQSIFMHKNTINQAVAILKSGGLVAIPTETVYGLGADAANPAAVARIFAAKGRPASHPLIVHIADISLLDRWAVDISPDAVALAKAFWPGPLTLILKKAVGVLDAVTGGQSTVGIRIPSHPVALELLKAFGGGVAAPSANQFTHVSPTTAAAVQEELGDKVDLILEGGECEVGLESTIIDTTGDVPVILRPGMITKTDIEAVLKKTVLVKTSASAVRVPGMHDVHYAPVTRTKLLTSHHIHPDELPAAVLTRSGLTMDNVRSMLISADPKQYAHDLYRLLRELDHMQLKTIFIEPVPEGSEWDAIRDRILKASGRG
jgi:L-threonylcarbamoyladenylate synthase